MWSFRHKNTGWSPQISINVKHYIFKIKNQCGHHGDLFNGGKLWTSKNNDSYCYQKTPLLWNHRHLKKIFLWSQKISQNNYFCGNHRHLTSNVNLYYKWEPLGTSKKFLHGHNDTIGNASCIINYVNSYSYNYLCKTNEIFIIISYMDTMDIWLLLLRCSS